MLKAKLVVVGGDAKAGEISLNLPTLIGRGRDVGLTLPHPLVSRQHCELFERDGHLLVKDLNSLNGTYVDNQRIDQASILKPDQLLTIGNVTFRAVYTNGQNGEHDGTQWNGELETASHQSGQPVIEMDQTAMANADGPFDSDKEHPVHTRPTQPGKRPVPVPMVDDPDFFETVEVAELIESKASSEVLEGQENDSQQASVCAALIDAGLSPRSADDPRVSELRRQLPAGGPVASEIDGLSSIGDPASTPVGDSFKGVQAVDPADSDGSIAPDESALGSFIRKLPR